MTSLGQAQEQTDGTQRETGQQGQQPSNPQIPFPVEIVEDDAAADARERSEEESRQREIADLAAQEGMNAATQSIDAATRDMRDYTLYSTFAVWIGTCLLIVTLVLTWMANKSARSAVAVTRSMGRDQSRAYVSVESAYVENIELGFRIAIQIVNRGHTPATWVNIYAETRMVEADSEVFHINTSADGVTWGAIPPSGNIVLATETSGEKAKMIEVWKAQGEKSVEVKGRVRYGTFFEETYETEFAFHISNLNEKVSGTMPDTPIHLLPSKMYASPGKLSSYKKIQA